MFIPKLSKAISATVLLLTCYNQTANARNIFDFIELFQSNGIDIETNFDNSPLDNAISKYSISCSPNDYLVEQEIKKNLANFVAHQPVESTISNIIMSGGSCRKYNKSSCHCTIEKYRLRRPAGDSAAKPNYINYNYKIEISQNKFQSNINNFKHKCLRE